MAPGCVLTAPGTDDKVGTHSPSASGFSKIVRNLVFVMRTYGRLRRLRLRGFLCRLRAIFHGAIVEQGLVLDGDGIIRWSPGVVVQRNAHIAVSRQGVLTIGQNTRIGSDAVIACSEKITLGNNVLIAARFYIADGGHEFRDPTKPVMHQGKISPKPVSIGNGSWIGINVCIMPGVTIGGNCVVAANSVVTESFPDRSVVGGVPARLIRVLQ